MGAVAVTRPCLFRSLWGSQWSHYCREKGPEAGENAGKGYAMGLGGASHHFHSVATKKEAAIKPMPIR